MLPRRVRRASSASSVGDKPPGPAEHRGKRRWRKLRRWWRRSARSPRALLAVALLALLVLLGNVAAMWRFLQAPERHVRPITGHADLFAESLWRVASQSPEPRGIVLPLFDGVALLGFSLILELRAIGVTMPIEVPHCGDLSPALMVEMARRDERLRFYDACALASEATDAFYPGRKLFCVDLDHCHSKFRGFDIKVLGVVYSKFQEVMLLDADTMFFENPTQLWDTRKYRETGTLFFLDRMTSYGENLAAPVFGASSDRVGALHDFLASFDLKPFRNLETLTRNSTSDREAVKNDVTPDLPLTFPFTPSREIRSSHAWRLETGHFLDSSVVLWNKLRQPRATAILASFVSMNGARRPPSYGDKELFFQACELAESKYAVSDFGVGAIGEEWFSKSWFSRKKSDVLCGDALHFHPENIWNEPAAAKPFYINSDSILMWDPRKFELFRTVGRLAEVFPGNYKRLGFRRECMFGVGAVALAPELAQRFTDRQQFYDHVLRWYDDDLHAKWVVTKLELCRWFDNLF